MIKFDNNMSRQKIVSIITDSMIRIGLIAFVVVMCIKVFAPFVGLMLWALVLAIALYPMHLKLANMLGGKQGRSAVIIVLSGLLLVGGPSVMVGNSFQEHVSSLYTRFEAGTLSIDPPSKDVAECALPASHNKVFKLVEMIDRVFTTLLILHIHHRVSMLGISGKVFTRT